MPLPIDADQIRTTRRQLGQLKENGNLALAVKGYEELVARLIEELTLRDKRIVKLSENPCMHCGSKSNSTMCNKCGRSY